MTRLGALTTAEVGDDRVLLLPLGSTEQHGPHLPLDTDTVIAVAVAAGAAERDPAAVVAPPLAIGAAGEHAGFAGTLSIGTDVLAAVLVEIVRTAGREFAGVLVVNAHGGNADAVARAVATCRREGRRLEAWHARLPDADADAHAGATETSVMLAIDPAGVRMDLAEPGDPRPLVEIVDDLRRVGVAGVSVNGVLGDPTGASAEAGAIVLARWVDEVATRSENMVR